MADETQVPQLTTLAEKHTQTANELNYIRGEIEAWAVNVNTLNTAAGIEGRLDRVQVLLGGLINSHLNLLRIVHRGLEAQYVAEEDGVKAELAKTPVTPIDPALKN